MLIKEYRIPLPMTLEEYRIAQLYMIQKKSREESEGEGSAVEILENKPYDHGPNEQGQYTYKVYHIGRHLPNWFRSIAPKTALEVHEESWNAYPYTKTRFSVPFVDKFSLEVETIFVQDDGSQDNIFKLKQSELRQREIDVIDIVSDSLSGSDYKQEEDPRLYVSSKTERGPLGDDWISKPPGGVIMCSYKHVKVEFRYWGLQSKIERFIHDYGLRRVMLRAHRQAWAWQDEWVGLNMDDIRKLERETQIILAHKLGRLPPAEPNGGEEEEDAGQLEEGDQEEWQAGAGEGDVKTIVRQPTEDNDTELLPNDVHSMRRSNSTEQPPQMNGPGRGSLESPVLATLTTRQDLTVTKKPSIGSLDNPQHIWDRRRSSRRRKRDMHSSVRRKQSDVSVRTLSRSTDHNNPASSLKQTESPMRMSQYNESDDDSMYSSRPEWALDQIAMDSESDLEFFDAKCNYWNML